MGAYTIVKASRLKATAQYVGGLLIAAFFVALLSFIFSFLGNIFCAALAGMMLGALRTHKWQSIPVSIVFPLVLLVLLRGMKAELDARQIVVLSLGSFSAFWLAYGTAAMLFFSERRGPSSADGRSQGRSVPAAGPDGQCLTESAAGSADAATQSNDWLSLEMLQGNWSGETNAHPQFQNLQMRIQKERLTLVAVDSNGQARILGHAQLKLRTWASPQTLELSEPCAEAGAGSLSSNLPGKPSGAKFAVTVPCASARHV